MKLLLIDDNLCLTSLLGKALTQSGYETCSENDSLKAIETIRATRPDLIILDSEMPGKSGLEILGELKLTSDVGDTPVIILTGHNQDRDACLERYGCDVIPKTAGLNLILKCIKRNTNLGSGKSAPYPVTSAKLYPKTCQNVLP